MYKKRKFNKILIVDDSDMNRALLADMLGAVKYFRSRKRGGSPRPASFPRKRDFPCPA